MRVLPADLADIYGGGQKPMTTLTFNHRMLGGLIVISLLILSPNTWACEAMAANALEKLYCQIQAKGEGQGLPGFDDFRRNPESTQRLLLKRPAARAGLALPEPSQPKAKPASPAAPNNTVSNRNSQPRAQTPAAKNSTSKPIATGLRGCNVLNQAINCQGTQYRLLDNKRNTALAIGALDETNQLQLPPVPNYRSQRELHQYLMHAYGIYIEKMDSIGLAGNTLSYSKFYYIFEDVKSARQDFVARFKNMFTYLKKDKSTIGIGRSHTSGLTPKLNHCEMFHGDLITCDDHGKNWVYKR